MNRILVVDDEESIRGLLKSFLEKKGYEVICASSGVEALEEMEKKPALVLLDILMSDIHGLQVLRRIKEREPSTAVIMVTGLTDDAIGAESLHQGADDFITKPIDLHHLHNVIAFHIQRNKTEEQP